MQTMIQTVLSNIQTALSNPIANYVIGAFTSFIITIIGVLITFRHEKKKEKKLQEQLQRAQLDGLENIIIDVRDWALELKRCAKEEHTVKTERHVSSAPLYNKLACNEIPPEHRKNIFEMAVYIDDLKQDLEEPVLNYEEIAEWANLLYGFAQPIAKEIQKNTKKKRDRHPCWSFFVPRSSHWHIS